MTAAVLRGDARRLPLPDASVDLIMTSPPYFGLRSYTDGGVHYTGQIGSEATPGEWLAALLECTAEWVRVLKPEGSIFVNLGDKYSLNNRGSGFSREGKKGRELCDKPQMKRILPLPEKCLLGLPWRYALACTDQLGLILRAEIIWEKLNSLPESVQDRVRRSHEQIFHLVKQPRYYSSVDEIRSPSDSPRRAGFTASSRTALGPELGATVRTDDGPAITRGWCQLGSLQERIRTAMAGQAQGLQVLRPVGFHMRVETPERNYVVDLDTVSGPALDAATAVPLEDALAKLWPAGPTPRLVAAAPAGILLTDVVLDNACGRAEVLDLEVTPVAAEGLAARLTLNLHPGRATLLVWTALGSTHSASLPLRNTPLGRLPGSVWGIPSQPLMVPESLGVSHFAAFPPALVRPVVLGWSPPGVCTGCGEGRRPVHDGSEKILHRPSGAARVGDINWHETQNGIRHRTSVGNVLTAHRITGYACACGQEAPDGWQQQQTVTTAHMSRPAAQPCDGHPNQPPGFTSLPSTRPALVLDPFGGTGTTALVASVYGRHGISVDLSADYTRLARWRTTDPGERARAMQVPKPPPVPDGQDALFAI